MTRILVLLLLALALASCANSNRQGFNQVPQYFERF